MGFNLRTAERILCRFLAFADNQQADHITTELFLQWKQTFGEACRQTWAARLSIVRLFAQWLHGIDHSHEVPPRGLIPGRRQRSRSYIYSELEIQQIVTTAGLLPSASELCGLTYSTMFGLIAVTGLRVSEAIALDQDDVDFVQGVLTIRQGKSGKGRLVPVSPSTLSQLARYVRERDRIQGSRPQSFFASDQGAAPVTAVPGTTLLTSANNLDSVHRSCQNATGSVHEFTISVIRSRLERS